jgi:hypothetical protein
MGRRGSSVKHSTGEGELEGTRPNDRIGDDEGARRGNPHRRRLYSVWSAYKVTGSALIEASSAAEAARIGRDGTLDGGFVEFDFSDAWGETQMKASRFAGSLNESPSRVVHPPNPVWRECPAGCGCITEGDPDRHECACDGPCTLDANWPYIK